MLALEDLSIHADHPVHQFRRRGTSNTINPSQSLQKLARESSSRAIKTLNNRTISDIPNHEKDAEELEITQSILRFDRWSDHSASRKPRPRRHHRLRPPLQ